jgi:hypothetical protein
MIKTSTFREAMWNRYLALCSKLVSDGLTVQEIEDMTTAFRIGAVGRDAVISGHLVTHIVESVLTHPKQDEHLFTLRSRLTKQVVQVTSDFVEVY